MFRILTYNIYFDNKHLLYRTNLIANIILDTQPDVVGFQEVTPESLSILHQRLKKHYNFTKTQLTQTYDTIMISKHPITRTLIIPFSKTLMGRNIEYMEITVINSESNESNENNERMKRSHHDKYAFINTHLESVFLRNKNPNSLSRIDTKINQFQQIFCQVPTDCQIFIMGDMNITDKEDSYFIPPKTFVDSALSFGLPEELLYTYDYKRNNLVSGKFQSRLDRIYHQVSNNNENATKKLELVAFELIGCQPMKAMPNMNMFPSDHFGYMIELN